MTHWRSQNSTTHEIVNGVKRCLNTKDDVSNFFLYQSQRNRSYCSGLDYASYKQDVAFVRPAKQKISPAIMVENNENKIHDETPNSPFINGYEGN